MADHGHDSDLSLTRRLSTGRKYRIQIILSGFTGLFHWDRDGRKSFNVLSISYACREYFLVFVGRNKVIIVTDVKLKKVIRPGSSLYPLNDFMHLTADILYRLIRMGASKGALLLAAALVSVLVAPAAWAAPYVIFKFDDLDSSLYPGFKWTTDLLKSRGAKGGVGIFTQELSSLSGSTPYENYVRSLINDPNFEVWFHSVRNAEALYMRSSDFNSARNTLLSKFDYLPRTYGPHWSGGDATTAADFNSDPFFKVWLLWGYWLPVQQVTNLARIPDDYCVRLELAGSTPGLITPVETFISTYNSRCGDVELIVLEGHAWAYTDSARQTAFTQIVDFLISKQVRWINAWGYHKLKAGITDTSPPPAPSLQLSRNSSSSIRISWPAAVDPQSAIDGYKVYRNGAFVALVQGLSYTDSPGGSLPDSTQYQAAAINAANLSSVRSVSVSLATPPNAPPTAPTGFSISLSP